MVKTTNQQWNSNVSEILLMFMFFDISKRLSVHPHLWGIYRHFLYSEISSLKINKLAKMLSTFLAVVPGRSARSIRIGRVGILGLLPNWLGTIAAHHVADFYRFADRVQCGLIVFFQGRQSTLVILLADVGEICPTSRLPEVPPEIRLFQNSHWGGSKTPCIT